MSGNTPVLQLNVSDIGGRELRSFPDRVSLEQELSSSLVALDLHVGNMTGSTGVSIFTLSGSASDLLGDGAVVGAEYNRSCDRVIQEVVCWAASSGSGGVSTVDVQIQNGSFATIFLGNNAYRPAVSASLGNFGLAKAPQDNMVSGSNMVWARGTLLKTTLLTAAGAAGISGQKGLVVQVCWKPSGSYGA